MRRPDVFEQQRVRIAGDSTLGSLAAVVLKVSEMSAQGFRLQNIELVFERPQAVAAPRRANQLPPTSEG